MLIRATRIIDWDLHLLAFRSMIPWYFACDKVNYSRYGPAYWLEMTSVETTHPGLFQMHTYALCNCAVKNNLIVAHLANWYYFLLFIGILPDLSSNFSRQRQNDRACSAVACDNSKTKVVLLAFL